MPGRESGRPDPSHQARFRLSNGSLLVVTRKPSRIMNPGRFTTGSAGPGRNYRGGSAWLIQRCLVASHGTFLGHAKDSLSGGAPARAGGRAGAVVGGLLEHAGRQPKSLGSWRATAPPSSLTHPCAAAHLRSGVPRERDNKSSPVSQHLRYRCRCFWRAVLAHRRRRRGPSAIRYL